MPSAPPVIVGPGSAVSPSAPPVIVGAASSASPSAPPVVQGSAGLNPGLPPVVKGGGDALAPGARLLLVYTSEPEIPAGYFTLRFQSSIFGQIWVGEDAELSMDEQGLLFGSGSIFIRRDFGVTFRFSLLSY